MPNTALLNDRVGIPNRLWPDWSDLPGPQCQALQLESPKNGSTGSSLSSKPSLVHLWVRGLFHSLHPPSYTLCLTHATRWDYWFLCSPCIITVSCSCFTKNPKELLLFNSSAANMVCTSYEPTKSTPKIYTRSSAAQCLQQDQFPFIIKKWVS